MLQYGFFPYTPKCVLALSDHAQLSSSRCPTATRNLAVDAAKAFQYLATILMSFIIVVILVAAFMPAPITGKIGLAVGISLIVFSVFELIAFALMAAFAAKGENLTSASG